MTLKLYLFVCGLVCLVQPIFSTLVVRRVRDVNEVGSTGLVSDRPLISSMHIVSQLNARYAEVVATTHVDNMREEDKETTFFFYLPLSAFISKFTMEINGVIYNGVVMGKQEAKKVYEEAKDQNETAGHVEQDTTSPARRLDMDMFTVSINLAARASAVFELRYQELIERKNGIYKHVINVKPNQIVLDFLINCSYNEPQGFELFSYMLPKSKNSIELPRSAALHAKPTLRVLTYRPTVEAQATFDPESGIDGDFVVTYDVKHTEDGLVLFTDDGYVVSYFSPTVPDTNILPKDIVFVIDVSGSMSGDKIRQARNSLIEIIDKLRDVDRFNIVLFDNEIELYSEGFVAVNPQNREHAKKYAEKKVRASGGTGINAALVTGVKMFDRGNELKQDSRGNIIIFLTDGNPTSGVTDTKVIRANIREINYYLDAAGKTFVKAVIYALAFGFDMNFDFLNNLAEENGGNARRIYERLDAKDQLVFFYDEVSNPYLSDVSFSICQTASNEQTVKLVLEENSMSRNEFPYFFSGSEIVIVALMPNIPPGEWSVCMNGNGINGNVVKTLSPTNGATVSVNPFFIENLYAYKQIKHYLMLAGKELNETLAIKYTDIALNMSLKHQFVTPLTSMVVTLDMQKQQKPPQQSGMERAKASAYYPTRKDVNGLQVSASRNGSPRIQFMLGLYMSFTIFVFLNQR